MNAEAVKVQYDQGLMTRKEAIESVRCTTTFDTKEAGEFLDGLRDRVVTARLGAHTGNLLLVPR